jgi:hypothetical protein
MLAATALRSAVPSRAASEYSRTCIPPARKGAVLIVVLFSHLSRTAMQMEFRRQFPLLVEPIVSM